VSRCSTTATTSARSRPTTAWRNAFDFPGFVPAYIRPLFCVGKGPFRWVALSGDPQDIRRTDARLKTIVPGRPASSPLARHGLRAHRLPGAAGAHLLAGPGRAPARRPGIQSNGRKWRARSTDRDRPRPPGCGLGRLAHRETEAMRDGSDAVSDWPLLNAMLNHGLGRDLGLAASRRRGRDGLLAACRRRDRVRRHRSGPRGASSGCSGTTRPAA